MIKSLVARDIGRLIVLVICGVVHGACTSAEPTATQSRLSIRADSVIPSMDLSPMSDQQIIDAVASKVPVQYRKEVKTALLQDSLLAIGGIDPQAQPLIAELHRRRHPDAFATPETTNGQARALAREANSARVLVALTQEPANPKTPRVSVIRTPEDEGIPLVLLRSADGTVQDLDAGIRAAAMSIVRHGASVSREMRLGARAIATQKKPAAGAEKYLANLRANRVPLLSQRDVPGVGRVKAATVLVDLPPGAKH